MLLSNLYCLPSLYDSYFPMQFFPFNFNLFCPLRTKSTATELNRGLKGWINCSKEIDEPFVRLSQLYLLFRINHLILDFPIVHKQFIVNIQNSSCAGWFFIGDVSHMVSSVFSGCTNVTLTINFPILTQPVQNFLSANIHWYSLKMLFLQTFLLGN